jgi:hypothetical protein
MVIASTGVGIDIALNRGNIFGEIRFLFPRTFFVVSFGIQHPSYEKTAPITLSLDIVHGTNV